MSLARIQIALFDLCHDILREIVAKCGIREIVALYSAAKSVQRMFEGEFHCEKTQPHTWNGQHINCENSHRIYTIFGNISRVYRYEVRFRIGGARHAGSNCIFKGGIMIFNNIFYAYDGGRSNICVRIDSQQNDILIYDYFFVYRNRNYSNNIRVIFEPNPIMYIGHEDMISPMRTFFGFNIVSTFDFRICDTNAQFEKAIPLNNILRVDEEVRHYIQQTSA